MTYRAIIYDFGQHVRRVDARESLPLSLNGLGDESRPGLDWTLETLSQFTIEEIIYIGDYHIEKVITRFPFLKAYFAPSQTDDFVLTLIQSFGTKQSSLLMINASTILLPGALEKLCGTKPAWAVDGSDRSLGTYFFPQSHVAESLQAFQRQEIELHDSSLDRYMTESLQGSRICLESLAAPVTDQVAVAGTIFRGKAQTLDNLAPLIRNAVFLPRVRIVTADWRANPTAILDRISTAFSPQTVVVRSSVTGEDGLNHSCAGQYLSILNINSSDRRQLGEAIDQVIASFGLQEEHRQITDEVLVQPQVLSVRASGVLLTRDTRNGSPYFVINEDRASGRTDSVTAGDTNVIQQRYISWAAIGERAEESAIDVDTRKLLDIACELMRLSCLDTLDIEYVIDQQGLIYILQVRPLAAARRRIDTAPEDVLDMVSGIRTFLKSRMTPQPGLLGNSTIFGVMPDWNPAEMIGLSPRPLARSLYQKLIGESAWAEARARIGYRDIRPEPLIFVLGCRPYVDVRASLNSFLPAELDDTLGEKWVNACLDMIRNDHTLHDKIEFDVAITCLSPDWEIVKSRLDRVGVDSSAFLAALCKLTQEIIAQDIESIDDQYARLALLEQRRQTLMTKGAADPQQKCRQISRMVKDCTFYGLVSFSILARYAFISMSFLRGFLKIGVINQDQYDSYLQSLPTVASQIADDVRDDLPLEVLVERYGHLRPNSYEITSANYASDPQKYLRPLGQDITPQTKAGAEEILLVSAAAIEQALRDLGLELEAHRLIAFISQSISGREKAKFEFMKSVNSILETIAEFGCDIGLSREQVSFLSIQDFLNLETECIVTAIKSQLVRRASFNQKLWQVAKVLQMPDVILNPDDVLDFTQEPWRANFITQKSVSGRVIWLDEEPNANIDGAIVIIRAADPGYDWIFAHPIAGLITEFGGVASHMSIRAAEFGLPAAIGCGQVVIESLRSAQSIELDAATESIRPLS